MRLRALMAELPGLAVALGALANEGMNLACRSARELLVGDTTRRIAAVLVRVTAADEDLAPTSAHGFLLSQSVLADMSNASRHSTMRALNDFAEMGWIRKRYNHVLVTDADALLAFAGAEED